MHVREDERFAESSGRKLVAVGRRVPVRVGLLLGRHDPLQTTIPLEFVTSTDSLQRRGRTTIELDRPN